jgi:uncharacterized membrane protein
MLFSIIGWIIEFIFRSIKKKRFINPGFMLGITLPIYGFGGIILYALWSITITNILWLDILIISMISVIILTGIEYIGGYIALNYYNNRLWDYTNYKYNYKGLICPIFSLLWGVFSILFYFLIMPWLPSVLIVLETDIWLSLLLGFSYGLFIIDLIYSCNLMSIIREYAHELNKTLNLQVLKEEAYEHNNASTSKYRKLKPYMKNHINNELLMIKSRKNE